MIILDYPAQRARFKSFLAVIVCLLFWPAQASAHEGPPYAIMVDKMIGPCKVSVWADPDVGTGTFFIILEPAEGDTIPEEIKVEVGVQPLSLRLAEALYAAEREAVSGRAQFKAEVPFDAQELWRARLLVATSRGVGEASVDIEVTPPGLGRWDLLLYLFPFIAVGFLWLRAIIRGRSLKKARFLRKVYYPHTATRKL